MMNTNNNRKRLVIRRAAHAFACAALGWSSQLAANIGFSPTMNFSSPSSSLILPIGGGGSFQTSVPSNVLGFNQESIVAQSSGQNITSNKWGKSVPADTSLTDSNVSQSKTDANTNSISILQTDVANAGLATEPLTISTSTYTLTANHSLDSDSTISITVSSTIDGGGHSVAFAHGVSGQIVIAAGKTVTFTNVVFKDYQDAAIRLGKGASVVFGDGAVVELGAAFTLARDFSSVGSVTINGFSHNIDLNGNRLLVGVGRLGLLNTLLEGVQDGSIVCSPLSGSSLGWLALQNTKMALDEDVEFSSGGITIFDDAAIMGNSKFTYATNAPLYIDSNSNLKLDTGLTFQYSPSSANRDLITMQDATATLQLNGCTLISSTTGMRLVTGRLIVDSNNDIISSATSLSEAISFGDGNSAHDLTVDVMPGASLHVLSGILDYGNAS